MSQRNCNYCNTELVRFRKDENGNWHRYEDNQMTVEHTYKRCKAIQLEKKNYVAPAPEGQSQLPKQLTNPPPPPPAAPVQQQNQNQAFYSVLNKCKNLETELGELRKMFETQASIIDSMAQKITLIVEKVGYPEPKKLTMGNNETKVKLDPVMYKCRNCGKEYPDFQSRSKICCGDCIHILDEELWKKLEENKKEKVIDPWTWHPHEMTFCDRCKNKVDSYYHSSINSERVCDECYRAAATMTEKIIDPEKEYIENNEAFQQTQEIIKKDLGSGSEWQEISKKFICSNCNGVFHNGWLHFSDTEYCDECKTNIDANESWKNIQKQDEERTRRNRTIESINMEDDSVRF